MYTQHFGLHSEPFGLTPDPSFLYRSEGHSEALAALQIGLQGRRGLIVMTGEVGTGKTTLLYSLLPDISSEAKVAYITNTKLTFDEILTHALTDFGVTTRKRSRAALLSAFKAFLLRCADENIIAALVIDEAQNLEDDCLENLRLLSNVETFTDKLLQIVLVGQPELMVKLAQPNLRQLRERVAVYAEVKPLSWRDSYAYVSHRLEQAGGSITLFTKPALALVLWKAQGIPRRINILAHNAMLFAYGRNAHSVALLPTRTALRAGLLRSSLVPIATRKLAGRAALPSARRLPAYMIASVMVLAALWWLAPFAANSANRSAEAQAQVAANEMERPRTVRVPAGVTLSDLARQEYGRVDAHLIARIATVNQMPSGRIHVGDILSFPPLAAADQPEEK